jgi:hypothetical protein
MGTVAGPPVADHRNADAQARGDRRIRFAVGRAQDDLRATHEAMRQRARIGEGQQLRALGLTEREFELPRTSPGHSGSEESTSEALQE